MPIRIIKKDDQATAFYDDEGDLVTMSKIAKLANSDVRWTPRKKMWVVRAIAVGMIDGDFARDQLGVSENELAVWQELEKIGGRQGLRQTKSRQTLGIKLKT